MNNLLLSTLLAFLFISCGKNDSIIPQDEQIVDTQLAISRIIVAPNHTLQKKMTSSYVSLRYWKEENTSVTDDISLSVNGVDAKIVKRTPHEELKGTNVLFEIPAIDIVGEVKANYTIKLGAKTYVGEKFLRYVSDYNIAIVWEKLDKDYLLRNPHITIINKDGTFNVSGATVSPEPISLGLGVYGDMRSTAVQQLNPTFIPGLNGAYFVRYDTNRNLNSIEIFLGDENVDVSFDKAATMADITKVYGAPITDSRGRKIYNVGAFDIEVNVNTPQPTAIIKKVRNTQ